MHIHGGSTAVLATYAGRVTFATVSVGSRPWRPNNGLDLRPVFAAHHPAAGHRRPEPAVNRPGFGLVTNGITNANDGGIVDTAPWERLLLRAQRKADQSQRIR